jgi:putative tryptophan/tyrosine transport system substrate-binding protein
MRPREFITLLGSAIAWRLTTHAQHGERVRRIGALIVVSEAGAQGQARLGPFVQRLGELGWTDGRNARFDTRWGAGDAETLRRYARELVALSPDVIFSDASPSVAALQQASRAVPIVFAKVIDPVGTGLVRSMARPGGNTTGFTAFEYAIGAKWLELLKEIAPSVTRVAVLRDSAMAAGIGQFAAIQAVGPIGMELSVVDLHDAGALEPAIAEFAGGANGGLIVTGSPFGATHPEVIAALATRYKLPAVYPFRHYISAGGLASYGSDLVTQFRAAASYADRILKGEKPAELPVQAPTKYELVINLKSARAIGLTVPQTMLARADEVIE